MQPRLCWPALPIQSLDRPPQPRRTPIHPHAEPRRARKEKRSLAEAARTERAISNCSATILLLLERFNTGPLWKKGRGFTGNRSPLLQPTETHAWNSVPRTRETPLDDLL